MNTRKRKMSDIKIRARDVIDNEIKKQMDVIENNIKKQMDELRSEKTANSVRCSISKKYNDLVDNIQRQNCKDVHIRRIDKDEIRILEKIYERKITAVYHGDPDADYCGDSSHYVLTFGETNTEKIKRLKQELEHAEKPV